MHQYSASKIFLMFSLIFYLSGIMGLTNALLYDTI